MKKIAKLVAPILSVTMLASSLAVIANAKSLKDSFYSGPDIYTGECYSNDFGTSYTPYYKKCYAGTKGYEKKHYVRAWIGGSSKEPNDDTVADTGRCFFTGDGKATCKKRYDYKTSDWVFDWYFPRGYAKYGT